ncbi:MAG: hypothetical protein LKG36_01295 [[Lactobacillus] timonensis]|jgi:hypothetical protein|nr:hypothetical protein [[Lactobacillus] timonensis]
MLCHHNVGIIAAINSKLSVLINFKVLLSIAHQTNGVIRYPRPIDMNLSILCSRERIIDHDQVSLSLVERLDWLVD